MDILVVGATGVIGQPTVERLIRAGHQVRALVRDAAKASAMATLGAELAMGDLLEPQTLAAAVDGAEAVVNVASAIPTSTESGADAWRRNDAVRTTGTTNLLRVCREASVRRLVQASVYLVYGEDRGDEVLAEDAVLDPPVNLRSAVATEKQVRRATTTSFDTVVLRLGWLYGESSWHTQNLLSRLQSGWVRCHPASWTSPVAEQDAAACIQSALRAPRGCWVFNASAHPQPTIDLLAAVAHALGWPAPTRDVGHPRRAVRLDCRRAQRVLGWTPQRDTLASLITIAGARDKSDDGFTKKRHRSLDIGRDIRDAERDEES